MKNLKKHLQQGETLNGCWLNLGSALHQLQALEHTPAAARIHRILDMGADGAFVAEGARDLAHKLKTKLS